MRDNIGIFYFSLLYLKHSYYDNDDDDGNDVDDDDDDDDDDDTYDCDDFYSLFSHK